MWSYTKTIISIPDPAAQPGAPEARSCAVVFGIAHARSRETTSVPGSSYLDLRGHSRERGQQITVCNTSWGRDEEWQTGSAACMTMPPPYVCNHGCTESALGSAQTIFCVWMEGVEESFLKYVCVCDHSHSQKTFLTAGMKQCLWQCRLGSWTAKAPVESCGFGERHILKHFKNFLLWEDTISNETVQSSQR